MEVLGRSARTDKIGFRQLVKRGSYEIAEHWRKAVRAQSRNHKGGAEPLLLDAVPLVLEEVLRVIQVDDCQLQTEKICSAARHGRERAREKVDVSELVRECQLLREKVFGYLDKQVALRARNNRDMVTIYQRVGLALDMAMRETVKAFVEEHLLRLRHLSRTDSLTGLLNHRTFYERLGEELKRANRYVIPLSIVLLDLDNFKSVNDTRGHQFGDHLLIRCAEWLRLELRETDIICRYGGDEFGVILTETTGADACAMMSRLAHEFKEFGPKQGAPASFGMSFGVASHPEDNGSVRRLVKVADDRLFRNKKSHRSTVGPVLVKTVQSPKQSRSRR